MDPAPQGSAPASFPGMNLHPDIAHLEFLVGTWRGRGRGDYPTIDSFEYNEEVTFSHVGKPFVHYSQKTKDDEGLPLHTETGYLRAVGDDRLEMVIAQPTGVTEIHEGRVHEGRVDLIAVEVGNSFTAKEVSAVRRSLDVDGDVLHYVLEMAAVGRDLQFHLEARLERIEQPH